MRAVALRDFVKYTKTHYTDFVSLPLSENFVRLAAVAFIAGETCLQNLLYFHAGGTRRSVIDFQRRSGICPGFLGNVTIHDGGNLPMCRQPRICGVLSNYISKSGTLRYTV